MAPLSQEYKHSALVQLRSCLSTRKVVVVVGMSQSSVAHMMNNVGGKIERQRGERPKPLADREKRHCVTLVPEG
jgi:hypothetical protein